MVFRGNLCAAKAAAGGASGAVGSAMVRWRWAGGAEALSRAGEEMEELATCHWIYGTI